MSKKCLKCGYTQQSNDFGVNSACPKCGAIYSKVEAAAKVASVAAQDLRVNQNSTKSRLNFFQVISIIIAVAIIGGMGYQGFHRYTKKKNELERVERLAKIEEEIKKNKEIMQRAATEFMLASLKEKFKDPASAQFSDLKQFTHGTNLEDGQTHISTYVVCGNVNAKNSYGGYVGNRPFYAQTTLQNGSLNEELTYSEILNTNSMGEAYQELANKVFARQLEETCKNISSPPIKDIRGQISLNPTQVAGHF